MENIFDTWIYRDKKAWMVYTVIFHSNGLNLNQVSALSGVEYKTVGRIVKRLESENLVCVARTDEYAKRQSPIYQCSRAETPNLSKIDAESRAERLPSTDAGSDAKTPNLMPNHIIPKIVDAESHAERLPSNDAGSGEKTPDPVPNREEIPLLYNINNNITNIKKKGTVGPNAESNAKSKPSTDAGSGEKTPNLMPKKGRLKFRERPIAELEEFHEKVLHIYETVCFKVTGGFEATGNYGKAIGLINHAKAAGYTNLREYEASIKFWYTLDGDWESGHKIDRWAGDIVALIERAKKAGMLKKEVKEKDPSKIHDRDSARLRELGLYDPDKDPMKK